MQVKTLCLLIKQMTNSREKATFICSNVKKTNHWWSQIQNYQPYNPKTHETIEKMKSSP